MSLTQPERYLPEPHSWQALQLPELAAPQGTERYCPEEQLAQSLHRAAQAPTVFLYLPVGQFWQLPALAKPQPLRMVPIGQPAQEPQDSVHAPKEALKETTAQSLHAPPSLLPQLDRYFPAAQLAHATHVPWFAPAHCGDWCSPAGQPLQPMQLSVYTPTVVL